MKEFVISDGNFKFSVLDKVPAAAAGQCILLYREGFGRNGSMVIDSYARPLASDVRRGKYNKIVYLSTGDQSADYSFQLAMKDFEFCFHVKVTLCYSMKDEREYYFGKGEEDRDSITKAVNEILRECDKQYGIVQEMELRNDLQMKLERKLSQYQTLRFKSINVSVEGDSDAQKILQSKREKEVEKSIYEDKTEIKVSRNFQDGKLMESENQLLLQKMQRLSQMTTQFGKLTPIMEEYFKGNIDGERLYEYIEKSQIADLNIVKSAVENELLSAEEAISQTTRILNNSIGATQQAAQIETKPVERVKETEEYIVDYTPEDEEYL